MTNTDRLKTLTNAVICVANMHGSVTGEDHVAEARKCKCEYGQTIRNLAEMKKEVRDGASARG